LITDRIAAAHGRFTGIRQVATVWTPLMLPSFHQSPKPKRLHSSSQPKRHHDRFSRFCRAYYCDRPTDRTTDHATRSL